MVSVGLYQSASIPVSSIFLQLDWWPVDPRNAPASAPPAQGWDYRHDSYTQLLYMDAGIRTQVVRLVPQVLLLTETSPQPQVELCLKTEVWTVMVAWLCLRSQWLAGALVWLPTLGLDPCCALGFAKPLTFFLFLQMVELWPSGYSLIMGGMYTFVKNRLLP